MTLWQSMTFLASSTKNHVEMYYHFGATLQLWGAMLGAATAANKAKIIC